MQCLLSPDVGVAIVCVVVLFEVVMSCLSHA